MNQGKCRSCEAPITWAINQASGKGNPLDVEPVPDGNLVIVDYHEDGRPIVHYMKKGETVEAGTPLYRSHFSSCADADSWRGSSTTPRSTAAS